MTYNVLSGTLSLYTTTTTFLCLIMSAPGHASAQRGMERQLEISSAGFRPNARPATHYSQL